MDLCLLKKHWFKKIENHLLSTSHSGSYVWKPVTSECFGEQEENSVIK